MKKVIIVGGGLSGITSGIYLLQNGFDVTIFEKNHYMGGYITTWNRKGSLIDGCMHWMVGTLEGTGINKIWKNIGGLGEVIHPESFCVVDYNGKLFHFYMDIDRFEAELYKYSDNDDELIAELIEAIKANGISENPNKMPYELSDPQSFMPDRNLLRKCRSFLKLSVHELSLKFNSPIIRYAIDNNLVNNKFQTMYFLQTLANFTLGNASLPVGCSLSIQNGIIDRYKSLGGKFLLSTPVDEIIVSDNKAIGVIAKGNRYLSDYVISACDLHHTEEVLLKGRINSFSEYDLKKEEYPTYSFFICSYRTKKDFKDLDIAVIKNIQEVDIDDFKINNVSIRQYGYDKTLITEDGYSTVQVYFTTDEDDYNKVKALDKIQYKAFKKKLGEFYIPILEEYYNDKFELIDVLSPLTYERYNNAYKGTFMPFAWGAKKLNVLTGAKTSISNLYYGNQWCVMPGGTPVALASGKFAAQLILHDEGLDYNL